MHKLTKNLIGSKFGRLTVIAGAERKNNKAHWLCICECGNEKITAGRYLRDENVQSCGCLNDEKRLISVKKAYTAAIKYETTEMFNAKGVYTSHYYEKEGDISFEDFYIMSQQDCYYCGSKPNNCSRRLY